MLKYENILNNGHLYNLFQKLVLKKQAYEKLGIFSIKDIDSSNNNETIKVMDIGCGPGTQTYHFLDKCVYYGFDNNPQNIKMARKMYSQYSNVYFECEDINKYFNEKDRETSKFDLVLMDGVFHHIDDDTAHHCLSTVKKILKEKGEFRSLDPVAIPKLSKFQQWSIDHDRGKYVRTEKSYLDLISPWFKNISSVITEELNRVWHTPFIYIQARI